MKKFLIALIFILVLVLVFINFFSNKKYSNILSNKCSKELKACPDGSLVGRGGPQCEFAVCPLVNADRLEMWQGDTPGVNFWAPENFVGKYISAPEWPPHVSGSSSIFSCVPSGSEITAIGQTTKATIAGKIYCINKKSEGAAGSTYTTFNYATVIKDKLVTAELALQFPQCENYDEPAKTDCKNEQKSFDPDKMFDTIISSTTFTSKPTDTTSASGIEGTVLLGPTCPVERIPPDPNCAPKPYHTNLLVTSNDGSHIIARFNSDDNGKYKVDVPPGDYQILSADSNKLYPRCASDTFIKVLDGKYTSASVSCDTGIR
jgi:hypothetical protein